jgi:hypothetical protein
MYSQILACCNIAYQQLDNGNFKEIKNRWDSRSNCEFTPAEVIVVLSAATRVGLFDQKGRCICINYDNSCPLIQLS